MAAREDVIIRFGGDARGLNATLGTIRQSVSGLTSLLAGLGAGISVGAATTAFKDAMAWGDDLANTARRVGLTTDAIQSLRNSAEFLGTSVTQVDDALTKFNVNVGKAADGTGELNDIAKKYGLQIRDDNGNLRDTTDIFSDYIALLQGATNTAERARIASAGLGRGAIELGQAIGESNVSLAEMIRLQDELGTLVKPEDVQRLSELQTKWTQLMQQVETGTKKTLVAAAGEVDTLLTGFERLGVQLSHWASGDFLTKQEVADLMAPSELAPVAVSERRLPPEQRGPSDEFKKYLEKRQQDTRTATQLELEIWSQYSKERSAQTQAQADAAQAAQENAFKALAKAGASDAMLRTYADIVGKIEQTPIKQSVEITVDAKKAQAEIISAITGAKGTATIEVTPVLKAEESLPMRVGNAENWIQREVDQSGATP